MNFQALYLEVETIRFSSAQQTQVQRWLNHRYAELWDSEEWIFKYAKANVTATSGSDQITNLPSDFGLPIGLWRDDGYPLIWMPPRDFYNLYLTLDGLKDTGDPQHFTMIDQTITVGPISNATTSSYTLAYERDWVPLVNDGDYPLIPAAYHYLLVTGALSEGLRLFNDFTWEFQEQAWVNGIQAMKERWLIDQRGQVNTWGRDEIEALPTAWGV